MTKPTGRPPGRPKGAVNKASRETRERAAASGLLPHEFLLAICRGEVVDGHAPTFDERLEAAKAAAPFYAPRLSNVAATISQRDPREMTDEELAFHIRSHARAAGEEWHPAKDGLQ